MAVTIQEGRTPFEIIANYHSTVVMNAVGWEGIYVFYPEYTLNDLLLRRLHHKVIMHNDACIAKYLERGWYGIDWKGSQMYMEQVEGLVERAQTPNDQQVFTPVLWNLH